MREGMPLLLYGDSYRFPDVYHLTRFLAPDAFITLERGDERILLMNSLEFGRAQKESRATSVRNLTEFGARELMAAGIFGDEQTATIIERFLATIDVRHVAVPAYFPVGLADALRSRGLTLDVVRDTGARRRRKRADELEAIEATQRATEAAWELAVDALRRADIGRDGTLSLEGTILTAERLRGMVESALLERGCAAESTIIAPGTQAADPHLIGSGPLRQGEAIVMDIFPQHKTTRYYADMTRTVSRGEPSPELRRMYDVVMRAQEAGIGALRPGVTGRQVHELVEDVIWDAGYDTLRPGQQRTNDGVPRGFIHGTGHGVGLEIHEEPKVSRAGVEPLEPGDVVTVEPGVYDPAVGGVRLEDMLVITESGSRNLTRAPRQLVV